jgi:hypothetical protein
VWSSTATREIRHAIGRGSWIRTNDLQYPKLPRYQAALYPDHLGSVVDTRLEPCQQDGSGFGRSGEWPRRRKRAKTTD